MSPGLSLLLPQTLSFSMGLDFGKQNPEGPTDPCPEPFFFFFEAMKLERGERVEWGGGGWGEWGEEGHGGQKMFLEKNT